MHLFAALLLTIVFISPLFSSNSKVRSAKQTLVTRSKVVDRVSITQNPEKANVSVAGKVKTPEGRPIKGAYIVIRDASTNDVVRSAYSSSFGFYRLDQIETGKTYVLSITHRRYLFALPAQLLEINEERSGVDFTGEPSDE